MEANGLSVVTAPVKSSRPPVEGKEGQVSPIGYIDVFQDKVPRAHL
jgi:hypothetical protein